MYMLVFLLQKTQVDCIVHGNKTNIECQLGNPLKRDEEVTGTFYGTNLFVYHLLCILVLFLTSNLLSYR